MVHLCSVAGTKREIFYALLVLDYHIGRYESAINNSNSNRYILEVLYCSSNSNINNTNYLLTPTEF